ncbi:TRANSLATION INITIATION FACTOR IF-2-RELATED [Salix koriyanagi]|uniref:TRANSLATION INITIATION FACTOR IF-2-RELATED n=1 Tax=Salix koriyanagi TaxID=2511006 RepID=A0A9Q0WCX8_9ROSI|nr:TRANSLATION INITIATION FACTOR IF-2-RELATED [Salix koriyanagi]
MFSPNQLQCQMLWLRRKSKAAEKKLPKHVREMQEALARRKEMEERKAKEEEEKRRKEEEERLRQEELERQAEEARRRKKEREKEKLLKKKQEGKLLTGKQKEEQRRLEAMRNQILANAGVTVPTADRDNGPTKRPRYQTKKSKPAHHQANGIKIEEHVDAKGKEQEEQDEVHEENGMEEDDDDEEWDAKSWDDVNLNVKGAFDDEEDSEPEHVVKKETKSSVPASRIADAKPTSQPMNSHDVENKKIQTEVGVSGKNVKKDATVKNKAVVSDSIPKQAEENLRSPICCIMGHVDTGKTKLLDCIRGTNVQEGEAGGITQQIGATYFPAENIRERTKELKADAKLNVPGLLVIDTPGHESFTNLRSRGSGLCDIAILVDRLYAWKAQRNAPIRKTLKQQSKDVQNEFDRRLIEVITQFKEQGLNTELYYKNKDMGETFNIVPTSAISGEGIPDLLLLLIQWSQKTMIEKLTFRNEVQCTVLEVKVIEGHGTTIDVVLVNGVLHEGDQIVVCGLQGPHCYYYSGTADTPPDEGTPS